MGDSCDSDLYFVVNQGERERFFVIICSQTEWGNYFMYVSKKKAMYIHVLLLYNTEL